MVWGWHGREALLREGFLWCAGALPRTQSTLHPCCTPSQSAHPPLHTPQSTPASQTFTCFFLTLWAAIVSLEQCLNLTILKVTTPASPVLSINYCFFILILSPSKGRQLGINLSSPVTKIPHKTFALGKVIKLLLSDWFLVFCGILQPRAKKTNISDLVNFTLDILRKYSLHCGPLDTQYTLEASETQSSLSWTVLDTVNCLLHHFAHNVISHRHEDDLAGHLNDDSGHIHHNSWA